MYNICTYVHGRETLIDPNNNVHNNYIIREIIIDPTYVHNNYNVCTYVHGREMYPK